MSTKDCQNCTAALPDLLLEPNSAASRHARLHLNDCVSCRESLAALQRTESLLDAWEAPELSPWFDQKLYARLREAQEAEPESFFERVRSTLLFSTGRQIRPMLAGALALVLALGGGTAALTLSHTLHPASVQASATVEDLQILDRNDQAIQTMDQLLQDDGSTEDNSSSQPAS